MDTEERKQYNLHAIQLRALQVLEISAKLKDGRRLDDEPIDASVVTLTSGHSAYNNDEHAILVKIGAEIGQDEDSLPFEIRVAILGAFEVDESRFPLVHISDWAQRNAPLVLYPYLREQVYNLTSRLGIQSVLLPLFEVPTFRIESNK